MTRSTLIAAILVGMTLNLAWAQEKPKDNAASDPAKADQYLQRLQKIAATTKFATPSFWAWELHLAVVKKDQEVGRKIVGVLAGLQKPDGRWGLGTDWVRGKLDFKDRLAEDAESWEVAEVGNAILDYSEAFGDKSAAPYARKAAEYLKQSTRYAGKKPYLPHMPECNHILQPHSTINAALLLSRVPGFEALGRELHESGVAMKFLRLVPQSDKKTLDPPQTGWEINDYEKIQIGYYLLRMNDPAGREILNRYQKPSEVKFPRGVAYLVLVYARLGEWDKAKGYAQSLKGFKPRQGYEYALKDIIDYVNERPAQ